jgi:predicted XRE-type DNA-binding protein
MKITLDKKRIFLRDLQHRMRQRDWNISRLAEEAGLSQSHVSRIAAGHFKTFSSNVMKICMTIGMEPARFHSSTRAEEDRRQITDSALSIWNGTHPDTAVVVSLLREIAKLRKHGARR